MQGFVAPTDFEWYSFLRTRGELDEVNFWFPSGRTRFAALQPGEPLFFKLKAPHDAIGGFGIFARFDVLEEWLAWEAFGERNGAPDRESLRLRIAGYAGPESRGEIGCAMLSQPVFFPPGAWIERPRDWPRQAVRGKRYDLAAGEGRRLWEACLARAPGAAVAEDRYGAPQLVRPRLGQGTFRVAVTQAYGQACAVTGEHSLPVLEAAHILPYSEGGEHAVRNGLLLRSDLHRLFDAGFVTVTPDHRFEVSRRLRDRWHNGRTYYAFHGRAIHLPGDRAESPDPALLRWHNEKRFAS
jgi:putative restriction endonuclease